MKYTVVILMSLFFGFTSCKSKKNAAKNDTKTEEVEIKVDGKTPVIYYEKSICFGRCPVFKFEIFSDGRAIYEGIANVEKLGKYEAKAGDFIRPLMIKAQEIQFDTLQSEYDNKGVTDLPSTFVGVNGKKVKCRYGCPEVLLTYYKHLDDVIAKLDWFQIEAPVIKE